MRISDWSSDVCSSDLARELASTMELAWLRIHSGQFLPLPSPAEAMAHRYSDYEREALQDVRARTIVGTPAQVRARIEAMAQDSAADEVMIVRNIFDHAARLRSYPLIAAAFVQGLQSTAGTRPAAAQHPTPT